MDDDLEAILDEAKNVSAFAREPWDGWLKSAMTQCRDAGRTISAAQLLLYLERKGQVDDLDPPALRGALSTHLTASGGELWLAVKKHR